MRGLPGKEKRVQPKKRRSSLSSDACEIEWGRLSFIDSFSEIDRMQNLEKPGFARVKNP